VPGSGQFVRMRTSFRHRRLVRHDGDRQKVCSSFVQASVVSVPIELLGFGPVLL
jgi:hypothetical protein